MVYVKDLRIIKTKIKETKVEKIIKANKAANLKKVGKQ